MKTRKLTPRLESLESRELLSGLAPRPYAAAGVAEIQILPLRQQALPPVVPGYGAVVPQAETLTVQAMSSYGYGPPPPPPPTILNLGTGASGPSVNSVGGSAYIYALDNNPNWKMTQITFEVSGAIESQTFTTAKGDYTRFDGITKYYPGGVDAAGINLFWDENIGTKTITVTATYDDPAHTEVTQTATATVTRPDVFGMTLTGVGVHMGQRAYSTDLSTWGIVTTKPDGNPGIVFTAKFEDTPSAGEFEFVQVMTAMQLNKQSTTTNYMTQLVMPGGPYVDVPASAPNVALNGKITTVASALADLPGSSYLLSPRYDSPGMYETGLDSVTTNPNEAGTMLVMAMYFDTYLVWHPTGGKYVSVAHLNWSLVSSATYHGSMIQPQFFFDYTDPTKWDLSTNHPDDWVENGDIEDDLVTWTDNVPNAIRHYQGPR